MSPSHPRGTVDAPAPVQAELAAELASLDGLRRGLAHDARAFVLEGTGPEVLEELRSLGGQAAVTLGLMLGDFSASTPRRRHLFAELPMPLFVLRLGTLYAAAHGDLPNDWCVEWLADVPRWLEVVILEASTAIPAVCGPTPEFVLTLETLEDSLALSEGDPGLPLRIATHFPEERGGAYVFVDVLKRAADFASAAGRHPEVVTEALSQKQAARVGHVLGLLEETGTPPDPWLPSLAQLATGTRKTLRAAATRLLERAPGPAQLALTSLLSSRSADTRALAAALLGQLGGAEIQAPLHAALAQEQQPKVRRALEEVLSSLAPDVQATPARVALAPPAPFGAEARSRFLAFCAGLGRPLSAAAAGQACDLINHPQPWREPPERVEALSCWTEEGSGGNWNQQLLDGFLAHPEVQLVHVTRLIQLSGLLDYAPGGAYYWTYAFEDLYLRHHQLQEASYTLGDVGAAFALDGADPLPLGRRYLGREAAYWEFGLAEVWPLFADHPQLLEEALAQGPAGGDYHLRELRHNALLLIAQFPVAPIPLRPALWELALGGNRREAELAQASLERLPETPQRLVESLSAKQVGERAAAARWLGRLEHAPALEPLRRAFGKEKQDAARADMLVALERLGAPVDELLDPATLAAEAERGLKKGLPKGLEWFPFSRLPELHWTGGAVLEPRVVTWWLVQAVKLKQPVPSPFLRSFASRCHPDEAQRLARFILDAWIAEDTRTPPDVDAAQEAVLRAHAERSVRFRPQTSAEEAYRELRADYLRTPVGSATKEKGLLAVVAAFGSAEAVPPIAAYVRRWRGQRAAQSKALLSCLAWIRAPQAVAQLVSVATRFPVAGFRTFAEARLEELAERLGWTRDELADRTVPTGGLDADGRRVFAYGDRVPPARRFVLTLDDALRPALQDDAGRPLKGLPKPRQGEDLDAVKAAKKAYSAARKELTRARDEQVERLRDALCAERMWSLHEWRASLLAHPLLGRLCQRLVWSLVDEGAIVPTSFRPHPDGSLRDASGEPIELREDARLQLAHGLRFLEEDRRRWLAALADVPRAFPQLDRPPHPLGEELRRRKEVRDFEGHLLSAFALRRRATALGYSRGPADDGPWFRTYVRPLRSLAFEAVVTFSGNALPEEDVQVALQTLHFERVEDPGGPQERRRPVVLDRVPPVFYSECWHDLAELASLGPGFHPGWSERVFG